MGGAQQSIYIGHNRVVNSYTHHNHHFFLCQPSRGTAVSSFTLFNRTVPRIYSGNSFSSLPCNLSKKKKFKLNRTDCTAFGMYWTLYQQDQNCKFLSHPKSKDILVSIKHNKFVLCLTCIGPGLIPLEKKKCNFLSHAKKVGNGLALNILSAKDVNGLMNLDNENGSCYLVDNDVRK